MKNQIKLSEVKGLAFIGGQITSRIEANEKKNEVVVGKVQVIPPKAIKSGKILHNELYELEYKTEFDEKKLTKAGDIVVKLSSPYDAAYITEADEGLLITSFCIIIRNTSKMLLSEYLAAFLNSGVYLDQVMDMVSGATVPMLTMGKIKDVVINNMEVEEQKQVAEYFHNISLKEEVMAQIIALEKEKLNSVLGGK
ncbi:MAG: hypothetical protein E7261_10530 [Lachnospiraceae bacterium]|nr:hypothetical protein [Lachnospiraceae bacterium]